MTPVIYSFILLTSAFFFYVFKVIFHHGAEAHLIKKSFVVWCWRHYVALKCRRTYNYTCQCTLIWVGWRGGDMLETVLNVFLHLK